MEDLETTIMELLVNAGAARSALTALQMAQATLTKPRKQWKSRVNM